MDSQFDELTKDLARGVSRRRALWRFGAGVVGTVLATMLPGRASQAAPIGERTTGGGVLQVNGGFGVNGKAITINGKSI